MSSRSPSTPSPQPARSSASPPPSTDKKPPISPRRKARYTPAPLTMSLRRQIRRPTLLLEQLAQSTNTKVEISPTFTTSNRMRVQDSPSPSPSPQPTKVIKPYRCQLRPVMSKAVKEDTPDEDNIEEEEGTKESGGENGHTRNEEDGEVINCNSEIITSKNESEKSGTNSSNGDSGSNSDGTGESDSDGDVDTTLEEEHGHDTTFEGRDSLPAEAGPSDNSSPLPCTLCRSYEHAPWCLCITPTRTEQNTPSPCPTTCTEFNMSLEFINPVIKTPHVTPQVSTTSTSGYFDHTPTRFLRDPRDGSWYPSTPLPPREGGDEDSPEKELRRFREQRERELESGDAVDREEEMLPMGNLLMEYFP